MSGSREESEKGCDESERQRKESKEVFEACVGQEKSHKRDGMGQRSQGKSQKRAVR